MSERPENLAASAPPRPRLALTLGVVGHRPNRLPEGARDSVAAEIGRVLGVLDGAAGKVAARHTDLFAPGDGGSPVTVLTGLAEGADRLAAGQALSRGQPQAAVLAFAADEFEDDFKDAASRSEFRDLRNKAVPCLELPGRRQAEDRAYEAAGRTILDNSDVVLAVWDGGPSAGRGGTTELIERAARENIPIIHVDAAGAAPTRVLWSGLERRLLSMERDLADLPAALLEDAVDDLVDALLRPPSADDEAAKLEAYLGESWRGRNCWLVYPWLLGCLGIRKPRATDCRPVPPGELASQFKQSFGDMPRTSTFGGAAAAHGWADALGVRYAQIFRGAYIANFALAALAVVLAAGSLIGAKALGLGKVWFLGGEFLCIAGVLGITLAGRSGDWHRRWIESREVAERLRVAMPLWLLGGRANRFSGEEPSWTGWYVRAHLRALGLAAGTLSQERLDEIKTLLSSVIGDQCAYHLRTSESLCKADHRIEKLGEGLFVITLVVVVAAGVALVAGWHPSEFWLYAITAATAGLPALGAAGYGIRLIGDFEGVAERSERTGEALKAIGEALDASQADLSVLRAAAEAASASMLGDVANWRLASETRKLAIPC